MLFLPPDEVLAGNGVGGGLCAGTVPLYVGVEVGADVLLGAFGALEPRGFRVRFVGAF